MCYWMNSYIIQTCGCQKDKESASRFSSLSLSRGGKCNFFVPLLPPSGLSGHSTHIPLLTFANLTRQPPLRLFSLYKEKLRRHRGLMNSTRQADIWVVLLFRWPPLNAPPADTVNHKRSVIANQSPDFPLFFCSPPAGADVWKDKHLAPTAAYFLLSPSLTTPG